jgi:hypothetical protein
MPFYLLLLVSACSSFAVSNFTTEDVDISYGLCLFSPFTAGRYHSLVIEKESFPGDELEITAWTQDGLIMAARHKKYKHLQVRYFSSFSLIMCCERKICCSDEFMRLKAALA